MSNSDLIVSAPSYRMIDGMHEVSATFRGPDIDETIWFRSHTPFSEDAPYAPEAFMAIGLFPAMRLGLTLRVEAPLSRELVDNLDRYQEINYRWYPEFRPTKIVSDQFTDTAGGKQGGEGMASFFTGGVDSFHTYLGNQKELTHALFLYGADIKLDEVSHRKLVSERLGEATREMGVEFLEVESNMLDFTESYCTWPHQFHGAGLTATGMLFSDRLKKVAIASSYPLNKLVAWGSHPVTDPLWSSPGFEVLHHGAESTRYDKIAEIAKSDLAMRYLRVCWENAEGQYNCGACEKCLRTMVALRLAGALDSCPVFSEELDLKRLPDIRYSSQGNRNDWSWNFLALRDVEDPELAEVMEEMAINNDNFAAVKQFAKYNNGMLASPEWQRLMPRLRKKLLRNLKQSDPEWFASAIATEAQECPEQTIDLLWQRHRKLLKQKLRTAERARRMQRIRNGLSRLGIGKKS